LAGADFLDGTLFQRADHETKPHNYSGQGMVVVVGIIIIAVITLLFILNYREKIGKILAILGETATELSYEYNRVYLEENEKEE
jgi:hypothetical protein